MLKKVGIVTAVTAAGLLALSPLALAGDYDGGHDDHHGHHHGGGHGDHRGHGGHDRGVTWNQGGDRNVQGGLINLQNVGVQVPIQACNNDVLSGVLGILSSHQSNRDSHRGGCSQGNGSRN